MALLTAPAAMADFQIVNNFDSGSLGGAFVGFSPTEDNMNGGVTIIPDPDDPAIKGILQLDGGTFSTIDGIGTHNVWFAHPIPDITGTATLYFRFLRSGLADVTMGTSAVAEPGSYGDYSALFRTEIDGIFDVHNDGYAETAFVGAENTWYEFWMVVDVAANTSDVYIKGGEYTEIQQLADDIVFRNNTTDPQNRFYARFSTGNASNPKGESPVWFDDVFIDLTGQNLTTPSDDVVTDPGEVPTENGSGELSNLSTRAAVATAENAMFMGFVATEDSRRFLIRGAGPLLADFGVTNALANPVITVRNAADQSVVATNTNWGDNSNAASIALTAASVGAQPFADGSADAALMLFLAPGVYTVEVASGDDTTGVALGEVYRIP